MDDRGYVAQALFDRLSAEAVRLEFQNGPLGFKIFREINLAGTQLIRR